MQRPGDHRRILRMAKLGQEGNAARRDIRGRRIKQRAVIGERDVVQEVMIVVGIEGAPAAIAALHADDPLPRPFHRVGMGGVAVAVQQHGDNGRVVDIRIVVIVVLERPAARRRIRLDLGPVAAHFGDLP